MSGPPQPKAPQILSKGRASMKRSKKSKAEFHPSTRSEVERRSGGRCEAAAPGCSQRAVLLHHKRRRSQGGSAEAENALHVCTPCHEYIHAHPREAAANGWMIVSRYLG